MSLVVPVGEHRDPSAALEPLLRLVRDDMAEVNEIILSHARSDVALIPELARHLIDSGGKRLRPMLTIAAAKLCGYEGGGADIKLAASVEFMHTATLLHDDVVDESDMRRGKKTARMLWGNQASVLVGDFLLGQAFRMMVEVGSLSALKILSEASSVIAEGEVMQLAASKDMTTTEEEYLRVIFSKTAALFAAAAEIGAVVAGRSEAEQEALRLYGTNIGLAFQLIDDALDYSGEAAMLGKRVGDDFREGKITLPAVLSYRRGSPEERAFWQRTLQEGAIEEGDLAHAIALMRKHRALEETVERAHAYGEEARAALAVFPNSVAKNALLGAVEFSVSRAH
jgi:octaprenyl-diphosphate synthase